MADFSSKERVLTAFAREVPDRVPINYLSNPGIDGRLKAHFGLANDDHEGLRQALGVDFRAVRAPYVGPPLHDPLPDVQVDPLWGIHRRFVEHESGSYWDYTDFPLRDADLETVANWPMPSPDDYDYSGVEAACERYAGFAINGAAGFGDIINGNGFLRGMEQTLIDLALEDPVGLLLADRRMAIQVECTRRIIEAAKGRIDFLWLGEDLGTQRGPIISEKLLQRVIAPRYKAFCDLAKAHDLPVMMHCCGSSSWAFDAFVEWGIGVVDTLQPEAKDMEPAYLKATFGDRLAFHGCISTAGPVVYGTEQEVIDDCTEKLEVMMPGGGYCFAPTHQLQDNSPTENVLAMYEVAKRVGVYG